MKSCMNDSWNGANIPPSNQSTAIAATGNASACSAPSVDPEPARRETRSTVVANSRSCSGTITAVNTDDNKLVMNSTFPARQHSANARPTNRKNLTMVAPFGSRRIREYDDSSTRSNPGPC